MAHTVIAPAAQGVRWRHWVAPAVLFLLGLVLYSTRLQTQSSY
jgi:hypothetical protein